MTTSSFTGFAALSIFAAAVGLGGAEARSADPLPGLRDKARVLVVLATDASDPKLSRQRALFRAMGAEARERDLVLVEGIGAGAEAAALRRRFDLEDGAFHAVLVGKDGGDKLTSQEPLGPETLFPLIDSMPMRQWEMKQRS